MTTAVIRQKAVNTEISE